MLGIFAAAEMNSDNNDNKPLQQKHVPSSQPLSQIICCKLCFTVYRNPKLLPCLHSFCASCLQTYCDKSDKRCQLQCPSCTETFEIPQEGVLSMQSNVVLERAINNSVQNIKFPSTQSDLPSPVRTCFGLSEQLFGEENIFCNKNQPQFSEANTQAVITTMNDYIDRKDKTHTTARHFQDVQCLGKTEMESDRTKEKETNEPEINQLGGRKQSLQRLSGEFDWLMQDQRPLVKSMSEFSSFSISSLKFEPPQDILEGFELYSDNETDKTNPSYKEEMYPRDILQKELAELQSEALRIIYSIDNLNGEGERLKKRKKKLYKRIQDRSTHLQEIVTRLERRLLLQLEAFNHENHQMDIIERHKRLLHSRLKGILAMTDFTRLLLDHGESDEQKLFQERIAQRKREFNGQNVCLDKSEIDFNVPMKNAETIITELFGSLDVYHTQEHVMGYETPNDASCIEEDVDTCNSQPESLLVSPASDMYNILDDKPQPCNYDYSPGSDSSQHIDPVMLQPDKGITTDSNSDLTQSEAIHARRLALIKVNNLSPRHAMTFQNVGSPLDGGGKQISPVKSPIAKTGMSPQQENENIPNRYVKSQSRNRPISSQSRRRMGRRHTEGNIDLDGSHLRIYDMDDDYDSWSQDYDSKDRKKLRNLTDDIQRTKRMMALCKKQLLDAQMSKVPQISPSGSSVRGNVTSDTGHVSAREKYEQTRVSARRKSYRWRSASRESISSCDGD